MKHEAQLAVISKLLLATQQGAIKWRPQDAAGWWTTNIGGQEVRYRFLYFEATNQAGADPRMVEMSAPGLNAVFACGTPGFDLILEILETAFDDWRDKDPNFALRFLEEHLPMS